MGSIELSARSGGLPVTVGLPERAESPRLPRMAATVACRTVVMMGGGVRRMGIPIAPHMRRAQIRMLPGSSTRRR